ncbi:MAG: hypothetical protein JXQ85_05805 [Cognatishimia sp.]|uniref:hypothetical protein n=1 Tax=Cognatishimia sp. TaxID=2211648 RepID=UPI003B8DDDC1
MSAKPSSITVITGDLVKSTQLSKAELSTAIDTLETCAQRIATWQGTPLNFTRHRGDGWQVILSQPRYALRAALLFRTTLKALGIQFDSYIGIATGTAVIEKDTDLNNQSDPVFVESGRALETLKTMTSFAPKLACAKTGPVSGAITLADHICSDWTPAQSEAVSHMLHPDQDLSYTDLAKILNKSRQTVTKTLNAAGFQSIFLALRHLEQNND